MQSLDRLAGPILFTAILGVIIGLPLYSCIRDAKGLKSTAPICASTETLEECLAPLPPVV